MRLKVAALIKAFALLAMIHFAAGLAVQIEGGRDVEYYLGALALAGAIEFAWADAALRSH